MSKSIGNVLLAHDLIKDHKGEVLRLALLSAHYRQPLDWNDQILHQAQKLLDKGYKALIDLKDVEVSDVTIPNNFLEALSDDLNTPLAIVEINKILKEQSGVKLKSSLLAIANLLGIFEQDPMEWFDEKNDISDKDIEKIEQMIAARNDAKKKKDFILADKIRDDLVGMGVEIKDSREGTNWQKI